MSVTACQVTTPPTLWSPAETLSPRVRQLRDQFWDFYNRDYTNEVRAFTSFDRLFPHADPLRGAPVRPYGKALYGRGEADGIARDPVSTPQQRDLARAISVCADGARVLAERYAAEAERLAAQETDSTRQAELVEAARICRKITCPGRQVA